MLPGVRCRAGLIPGTYTGIMDEVRKAFAAAITGESINVQL